jgi:putative peptidoglycan lipid II flippase
MADQNQVVRAAGVLMAISVLARLAGFIREQAIAAQFGTTMATDAYVVAYTVANIVYLIIGGALATVFIPVFASYLTGSNPVDAKNKNDYRQQNHLDRRSAWNLASTIINLTVLVLGGVTIIGIAVSPWLVQLIAPGFAPEPEKVQLTTQLTQIMFPITLLFALSMLFGVTLNTLQHFAVPALGSVVFSLTVLASVFTLGATWGIKGLAAGTVIATVFQVAIQVPVLWRKGMRYSLVLDLKHPGVRQIGVLMGPVLLGNAVAQAYVFIERIIASHLAEGCIAALNFANKLYLLPFNLFALAINIAIFPTMSAHAANNDLAALRKTTFGGLKLVGLLTIPAMVWLIVLAEPIVRLTFERGAFDDHSTGLTTFALSFYVLGLFALGAFNVLNRAFYALHDTRTPVLISIFTVLFNLALALILVRYLQHGGLALAAALAANLNLILAYYFLRPRLPDWRGRELFAPLGKIVLASGIMGAGIWVTARCLIQLTGGSTGLMAQLLTVGIASSVGLIIYLGLIWWWKPDEELVEMVRKMGQRVVQRVRG